MTSNKRPFDPIRLPSGAPAKGDQVNRIQDAIAEALSKIAAGLSGVTKITSRDRSIVVSPLDGVDRGNGVNLSAFKPGSLPPGTTAITIGSNAPNGTTAGDPVKYLKVTIDGVPYVLPMWAFPGSATFPTAGLIAWYKDDGFPANGGGFVSGPWQDQSGNGLDLTGGFAVDLSGTHPALLSNGSHYWEMVMRNSATGSASNEGSVLLIADLSAYATGASLFGSEDFFKFQVLSAGSVGLKVAGTPTIGVSAPYGSGYVKLLGTASNSGHKSDLYVGSFSAPAATDATSVPAFAMSNLGVGDISLTGFGAGVIKYYEAAAWDHVLTPTERASLSAYLAAKY